MILSATYGAAIQSPAEALGRRGTGTGYEPDRCGIAPEGLPGPFFLGMLLFPENRKDNEVMS